MWVSYISLEMWQNVGVLYLSRSSNSCEAAHIDDELAVSVFQYAGVLYILLYIAYIIILLFYFAIS